MIETKWMPELEHRVLEAAAQGGLPELRSPHAAFNGDELLWEWREYLHNDEIVADVRLRVAADEPYQGSPTDQPTPQTREFLQAFVSGLAWSVDPRSRHLSRLAFSSSRDAFLSDSREDEQLWLWLADRLRVAWVIARQAAAEVFAESERQQTRSSNRNVRQRIGESE